MGFKLSIPAKVLEKELREDAKKLKKAGVRALNKTATQSRNFAQRETRKVINIKASKIKKAYAVVRAKINQPEPHAEINVRYTTLPVIEYNGVRQTRKGVSVKMRKDKGRKLFKGAFIQKMPSGHRGVFRRKSKRRLPIRQLRGPSVHSVFVEKLSIIEKKSSEILDRVYTSELNFIFGKT